MNCDYDTEIREVLKKIDNLHYPGGPIYAKSSKVKALLSLDENELEGICYLVESHAPNLRFNTIQCYEKFLEGHDYPKTLNKEFVNFQCSNITVDDRIKLMLNIIENLPKEWTVVQLTSEFNVENHLQVNLDNHPTTPFHLTVFNCGQNRELPFSVKVDAPRDKINGDIIEVSQELHSIIKDNTKSLENFKSFCGKTFKHAGEKMAYSEARFVLNNRLENLVKTVQNKWLAEWRCLFTGKFLDENLEKVIDEKVSEVETTERNRCILKYLIKGSSHLNIPEIKNGLLHIFPKDEDKNTRVTLAKEIRKLLEQYKFTEQMRHPVLLIIDEKLDVLPWETLDIIENHPVSRMPSLHFTYALYKEHESSIVNGIKVNINTDNGTYLINPGLDLVNMENRLKNFFSYWLPDWQGLVGVTPSEDDFKSLLQTGDIFIYSGHGSGTQFFASEKIQRMRIDKVVLLFGCSSVSLISLGPQVETFGPHQTYQIACSPCIAGMLWPVTDIETDLVTTEFLSQWIPSKAVTHWKFIDKKKWEVNGNFIPAKSKKASCNTDVYEPELLRALYKAKKVTRQFLMKAAFIARGLPVKIQQ